MTESVINKHSFGNIISEMKKANPGSNNKEIVDTLGSYVVDLFYKKINRFELPDRLDSSRKLKLKLQEARQTKKGKKKIANLIEKDHNIEKFMKLKHGFNQLTKFHASNDISFQHIENSRKFDSNTTDVYKLNLIPRTRNRNVDFAIEPLDDEPAAEIEQPIKKEKDDYSYQKSYYKIDLQDLSYLIEPDLDREIKIKKSLDSELLNKIKNSELETFDKKESRRFDMTEFIGIIDDEDKSP
ncbi:hypothetical protein LCGC14_1117720 [marine sediment metagenome]|uniref:Uncharacterized protein n=1 Tax=marine sediment metagenome TaxID=412755 RepID=A0A0F9M9P6_9ZZZZ